MAGPSTVLQSNPDITIGSERNTEITQLNTLNTDFVLRNIPSLLPLENEFSDAFSNIGNEISRSIGLDSFIENERKRSALPQPPSTNGKAEGYFNDTWESIKGDWRELKTDFHKTNSYLKQQSIRSSLFQQAGNGVDFVMDVVGSVVSNDQTKAWKNEAIDNLTKTHAYQISRNALAEIAGETQNAVDSYLDKNPQQKQVLLNAAKKGIKASQNLIKDAKEFAKNHPELTRNLKAFGEVIQLAGVGKAAQLGVRGGSKVLKVGWNAAKRVDIDNKEFLEKTISASSLAKIYHGYGKLSPRQSLILDKLPKDLSRLSLHKSSVSVNDLAALTAYTGDEFALFTRGSQRLVIRGTKDRVNLKIKDVEQLKNDGYRWSAHTHPGSEDMKLDASGYPGDRMVLEIFGQKQSLIVNSTGRRNVFGENKGGEFNRRITK